MATITSLIDIVRTDYLDDAIASYLWSDAFMYRSFCEAERQACNRANLIFDDTITINLTDGVSSYALSQKINVLQYVGIGGVQATHKSQEELERTTPAWRTKTGITSETPQYVIRGRTIRFIPTPTASLDATYIQDTAPTDGTDGDTWYDTTTSTLYKQISSAWVATPAATLATATLEVYRNPTADTVTGSYEPEIPDENNRDLIYWVLHEAYSKQDADTEKQSKSQYYLQRFTDIFGEYVPAKVRINQLEQDKTLTFRPIAYTKPFLANSDEWNDVDL